MVSKSSFARWRLPPVDTVIRRRTDHNVIETADENIFKMKRSFVPQNTRTFSVDELENIKKIYLKAIYKTAEQVF